MMSIALIGSSWQRPSVAGESCVLSGGGTVGVCCAAAHEKEPPIAAQQATTMATPRPVWRLTRAGRCSGRTDRYPAPPLGGTALGGAGVLDGGVAGGGLPGGGLLGEGVGLGDGVAGGGG